MIDFRQTEEYLFEDIKNYKYLTNGSLQLAGQDEKELYNQLIEALDVMGLSKDEKSGQSMTKVGHFDAIAHLDLSYLSTINKPL